MTFYLIGLGLDLKSLGLEAKEIIKKASKVYLEYYTVDFPYDARKLEQVTDNKIFPLTRIMVENEQFVEEAKKKDVVLLVYGSPLTATTHISLILKCKKERINYKILHNASILEGIGETGLQLYKFGKIASMPKWEKNYKPDSFTEIIKLNKAIRAHSLVLVDIGLLFHDALKQLEQVTRKIMKDDDRIIVASQLGTENSKIYYESIEDLYGREVYQPFCFVIPSELHFLEKEALELFKD